MQIQSKYVIIGLTVIVVSVSLYLIKALLIVDIFFGSIIIILIVILSKTKYTLLAIGLIVITIGAYLYFDKLPSIVVGVFFGSGITILSNGIVEVVRFYESTSPIEIRLHKDDIDGDGKIVMRRLSLFIRNKGNNIIEDSKGTVYIQIQEGDKAYDVLEKDKDIIDHNSCPLSKVSFPCCGVLGYLFDGGGSVRYELLPWAFSEKSSTYPIATNISPKQTSRLLLAIIREYPDKSLHFAVVSVYSERGEVGNPNEVVGSSRLYRTCLILKENRRIILNFDISGKNLRKEYKGRVEIYYENGKIKAECTEGCINSNDP